jgi:glycosyltransferase involved in cell wall biosynthesis
MGRNILLINHYSGSPVHGMEYRPYYLAREWVRQGHRVTIAAGSYSHVRQKTPVFSGAWREEIREGVRYIWLRTPRYKGNGWKRAANMLSFVSQLYRRQEILIGSEKLDAVIASSTYPFDIYPARRIARRHRAKLVFEVHDLWPLSLIELSGMSRRHPFIWATQRAEDYAYRHSDLVVSLLPKADAYMASRGMRPDKFAHLPNGVDVAAWREPVAPLARSMMKELQSLRNESHFLVGYAGSLGAANALHCLIDAAAILRDAPVAFVLVGKGPEKQALQQRIADHRLENVLLMPPIPKSNIPAFLAEIDAGYIGWKPCSLYRFGVSPNKLFDYMMAGKPIIHAIDAGNDPVADAQCGISISPESPEEVAAAVGQLISMSPVERQQMGARGRNHAQLHHDYAALARQFIALIERGADSQPAAPGTEQRAAKAA